MRLLTMHGFLGGVLGVDIAAISKLSYDVVPTANTARLLIFSAAIMVVSTTVIIATKGRLGRVNQPLGT